VRVLVYFVVVWKPRRQIRDTSTFTNFKQMTADESYFNDLAVAKKSVTQPTAHAQSFLFSAAAQSTQKIQRRSTEKSQTNAIRPNWILLPPDSWIRGFGDSVILPYCCCSMQDVDWAAGSDSSGTPAQKTRFWAVLSANPNGKRSIKCKTSRRRC